jgi:uncharacterized Zn finger protein (UPF0148 family)
MADEQWRPNRGVTFNKWKDCDRCGLPWPEKTMRRQHGILVCPECYDDASHEDNKRADQKPLDDVKPPWDPEEEEQ